MPFRSNAFVCCAVILASCCALAQTAPTRSSGSLAPTSSTLPAEDPQDAFELEVHKLLYAGDYDALENLAARIRNQKERFPGGSWKLWAFYEATGRGLYVPVQPSDGIWTAHIARLRAWSTARPESVTARIALAEAYKEYGFFARGSEYADRVPTENWKPFEERAETARRTLVEAGKLKQKCPHWFEVMQEVALAQNWPKPRARALLEEAIAFEPDYSHYYREYAEFLLPQWNGAPGEVEQYAEDVSRRVGGKKGDILYFEIATFIYCGQCGPQPEGPPRMSWQKIQAGYRSLREMYGISRLKLNRFARVASVFNDAFAAEGAFAEIGENWDQSVWFTHKYFIDVRYWAQAGSRALRAAQTKSPTTGR
jgi:hypothetical protein